MQDQANDTYTLQVEAGKQMIRELLKEYSTAISNPQISEYAFKVTHQDFDRNQVSLIDPFQGKVVAKLEENDIADSRSTKRVWQRIAARLDVSIKAYCKSNVSK